MEVTEVMEVMEGMEGVEVCTGSVVRVSDVFIICVNYLKVYIQFNQGFPFSHEACDSCRRVDR